MQEDYKGTGTLLRSVSDEQVDAEVWPEGSLEVLSQVEAEQLRSQGEGGMYPLLRRCILAVLNSGAETDDARAVLEKYRDFEVGFIQQDRGLKITIKGAPSSAFVDGRMIRGIREQVFAVLRDVVFINYEIQESSLFDLKSSENITNAVFHILRNAHLLQSSIEPHLVVCWGGHAISRHEYDYTKKVGYEIGLAMVNHPDARAVAFTGSLAGGRALFGAAAARRRWRHGGGAAGL